MKKLNSALLVTLAVSSLNIQAVAKQDRRYKRSHQS